MLAAIALQHLRAYRRVRVEADGGGDGLTPERVGQGEDASLADGGVGAEHALDLCGIDVLAAGDDHVVTAVEDVEVAVGVEVAGVTRVQPAAAVGTAAIGIA